MDLPVTARTIFGKGTRTLRAKGLVPAELYGRGEKNCHLAVVARAAEATYRTAGEHTVITLVGADGSRTPAVFADFHRDALSDGILAIDFHRVRMDEKLQAKVPVRLTGEAPAKREGYPIILVLTEIEVEALPDALPHELAVDVGALALPGQAVYVRDLTALPGVRLLARADSPVVTVGEKTKEEAVAAPAPAATAENASKAAGTTGGGMSEEKAENSV